MAARIHFALPIREVLAELADMAARGVGMCFRRQYSADAKGARAAWAARFPDPWRDVRADLNDE